MNKYAILHISDTPYAYAENNDTLVIRLRSAKDDLKSCILYYKDRYDWETPYSSIEMQKADTSLLFDYYRAAVSIKSNRYRYFFQLEDKSGSLFYLNEQKLTTKRPMEPGAFQYPYICKADVYKDVTWAQEGIIYNIFPDRFFNGDKENDPKGSLPWGKQVSQTSMFGGDIKGIIKKIPYLAELGITIIYMTPIFLSSSNHKYDTNDYYKIDPHFGKLEDIQNLVKECHKNNIHVLFDAVFNHCGPDFFAFKDVLRNGESSRYKDWFFIEDFPINMNSVNYYTFANKIAAMPKLNTANKEVSDYLLGVTSYWMEKTGIDGWRLDVCDEVDHVFWRSFRKTVKSINPEALIIGEIQHEASSFLRGDQMDGIMSYPFREAMISYFAKGESSTLQFQDELTSTRILYMDSINRTMFNLLGCHDTERFLTLCNGKKEKLMCAAVFQFTYIGIPYIYYGDEVGIDGGYDPLCRKCMIWDENKQDIKLLSLYKKLCKIRKENPCLVYGSLRYFSNDKILAYSRNFKNTSIITLINNSDEESRISSDKLNGSFHELLTNKNVILEGSFQLKPFSFIILKTNY